MPNGNERERSTRDVVIRWLDRVPTLVWIGLGAVVIVGVVALFGGLDKADAVADTTELDELAVGDASGTKPTDVTVFGAQLATTIPELYFEAEPGEELLIVELEALNIWNRTSVGSRSAVLLDLGHGEDPIEADRVMVAADLAGVSSLPPGVRTPMLYVWPVPVGAIGETARLLITDGALVTDSDLIDEDYWRDLGPKFVVTVPVQVAPHVVDDDDDGTDS